MSDLTPEQIQNWRRVLCGMIGPYALIMPDAHVQYFRDLVQKWADEQIVQDRCACDPKKYGFTKHRDGRVTCNKCQLPRESE